MGSRWSNTALASHFIPVENRFIFDDSWYWVGDDARKNTYIDNLVAAGINTVIPNLWRAAGVTWQTDYLDDFLFLPSFSKWENHSAFRDYYDPSRDEFGRFVELAHTAGLKVIPSFLIFAERRANYADPYLQKDWYISEVWPKNTFDCQNAEFRTFIVGLIGDVLSKFDVDGVFLDYVRAGTGHYLNEGWKAQYAVDSGGRDYIDDQLSINDWELGGPADPDALEVFTWQEIPIGDVAHRVRLLRDAYIPGKPIMAYAIGNNRPAYFQGQNFEKWFNAGDVDLGCQGWYGSPPPTGTWNDAENTASWLTNPEKFMMITSTYDIGPPIVPLDGADTTALVVASRQSNGVKTYGLYNYGQHVISADQKTVLGAGIFAHKGKVDWINP